MQLKVWVKTKRAKWLFALVAVFLMIMIFDRVLMPWYVRLGEEYELPDVVSLPLAQAEQILKQNDFVPFVKDSVYDPHFDPGTVVEQLPSAYSKVKKGRTVYLTVSMGEKPIIMPNLFFKSPREAELLLKNNGLKLGAKYYEYSDLAAENVVIGQSFPQGQLVKPGTSIDLTISLGRFPGEKKMPDLVGKSLAVAQKQLRSLGLKDIQVKYTYRDNILPETVIAQSVKAGTPIEKVRTITLTVSQVR